MSWCKSSGVRFARTQRNSELRGIRGEGEIVLAFLAAQRQNSYAASSKRIHSNTPPQWLAAFVLTNISTSLLIYHKLSVNESSHRRPSYQPRNPIWKRGRFAHFRKLVETVLAQYGACRILDIGGSADYWRIYGAGLMADGRVSISLLNLCYPDDKYSSEFDWKFERFTGDARSLDGIADKSFDVAHSNSVIEHVGRWPDMCAMAGEVRRVARLHHVQTPYWGFPIEPHNRTPFFHWLPEQFRYRLVPVVTSASGAGPQASMKRCVGCSRIIYLTAGSLPALFPTSSIHSEIVYGLTKSLVAVGGDGLEVEARSNTRRLRI